MKKLLLFIFTLLLIANAPAQLNTPKYHFTKADTLRGTNNENRNWWNVLHYNITVKPNLETKEIEGIVLINYESNINVFQEIQDSMVKSKMHSVNGINFKTFSFTSERLKDKFMQIDLQHDLQIDSVFFLRTSSTRKNILSTEDSYLETTIEKVDFNKQDGVYLINVPEVLAMKSASVKTLKIYYHGKPRQAKKAPWDGSWVWTKDSLHRPFISVACQGLGASSWFPCKDYQGDEPDNGATITIVVPDSVVAVANGKLQSKLKVENTNLTSYTWNVTNPINNYTIVPNIGNYVNFTDTFNGKKGTLDLSYWVLDYNKEKAKEQFKQAKLMLQAFEYWFGAYPFYEDGYKLIETPFLGMEHQSGIAYGNEYKNGYRGRDLSGSGWGSKWDFIIVHESGHEWFANNITTQDIADMWVHEGFTNYSEVLFTEYFYGKQAANEYCYGLRKNIRNDIPIIGVYGVNNEGSGDMYYKASNMLHSIRNAYNNDRKFRKLLIKMNETFYHQTVTTQQIENFIIKQTDLDLTKTFDQYLRTTQIPTLEYYFEGKILHYRYTNCIDGFNMPITIPTTNKTLIPTTQWQTKKLGNKKMEAFNKKNIEFLYLLKVEQANATTNN